MKLLIAVVSFLVSSGMLHAQNTSAISNRTNTLYSEALSLSQLGNSLKATQLLHEILEIDSTYYMAHFALADLSHEAGKAEEELAYLTKGLALSNDLYPAGFKFLAELLYKKGEYDGALERMEHFALLKKSLNPDEQLLLASCRFSVEAVKHPVAFQPTDPGDSINTSAEEYWPSLNAEANELVFTRLETRDKNGLKITRPQEDFYLSRHDSIGWRKAVPLGYPVNTDENEGAQTLSADGRLLIFTGCGRSDGIGSCDLYISINKNGNWTVPVNMGEPVNSGAWDSQPCLSADGETLMFVSSRKGGLGKMDIWKAEKMAVSPDGIPLFGNVTNVSELNTPGNDMSPFLHADGKTLYFASDGRPGLGGTDLFFARKMNGKCNEPANLGFQINTNSNEEGMVVEISGEKAWFTSDHDPSRGRDILFFILPGSLRPDPVSYLKGEIADAKSGRKLRAEIVLSNLLTDKIVCKIAEHENDGTFLVCLPSGQNYGLSISRKGYLFSSENIPLLKGFTKDRPKELNIRLQPILPGASTTLKNIFFETNSWMLLSESRVQLDEMARFMKLNPSVSMEVVGHTDNVGTESYNLALSQKRAGAVVSELKKRSVEQYRITGKGVGFSVPVGDNSTEEGKSANRRTEFIVKEVGKM
ncbi:MAG: OmpA family protein [Prolixibacteraceae bacterium]|nr:OmpA family protein [Prolixibacteraceae bacterium]